MIDFENNPAIGGSWEDLEKELCTEEEIAMTKLHAAILSELVVACNEGRITQKELDEIEGTFDAEIEETDEISARLDTVFKVLYSLGKTLAVVPLEQNAAS